MLDSGGMTEGDLAALRSAAAALEHPGLAARLTNMVGKPIELIGYALPASASQAITAATSKALEMALDVALRSMHQAPRAGSQRLHKVLATASGAAGGAFGCGQYGAGGRRTAPVSAGARAFRAGRR